MKFNLSAKLTHTSIMILAAILSCIPDARSANKTEDDRISVKNSDKSNNKGMRLIVIDPGHDGKIPDAHRRVSAEKDIVLQVSKKLKVVIEKKMPDVTALLTRDTDIDVPFHERTTLANKNHADLFISTHCNFADAERRVKGKNGKYTTRILRRPKVSGTETFVCGFNRLQRGESDVVVCEKADILLEDNYQEDYGGLDPKDPSTYIIFSLMKRTYRDKSIRVATYIQNEYSKNERPNRGVQAHSLAVLAPAAMLAVLTEFGFISNPEEEKFML